MGDRLNASTPELAAPVLAPLQMRAVSAVSAGLLYTAIASAIIWFTAPGHHFTTDRIPASPADLSERVVTPIDPSDRAGVAAASSMLRLSEAQRQQIEREVLDRQRRLAWIVLTDSMDPDGDTVAVESGGIVQHVVLSKTWMPVAVPLDGLAAIGITAVRDGGGGGVTIALATRGGPVPLRSMLPGERVEVMP